MARKQFELSEDDWRELRTNARVSHMATTAFWAELGRKLGFEPATARFEPKLGRRAFTAEASAPVGSS